MNIIIIGPRGKMGKQISKVAYSKENMNIVGGIGPKKSNYIGEDLGIVAGIGIEIGAKVVDNLETIIDKCDVIIDFTNPDVSLEVIKIAENYNKSVVCGTTGFSEEQIEYIENAAKRIPILYAANTSRVVNLMYKLLEIAGKAIGNSSDIEIIEMHDRNKLDAPSGTSKELGEILAKTLGKELNDVIEYGREGKGTRNRGNICYHSLRAGDISSSHKVMFGLMGERLEITHHAHSFECFAQGACEAATYLYNKKPGLYTVKDALNL